jgi:hypothetical protein
MDMESGTQRARIPPGANGSAAENISYLADHKKPNVQAGEAWSSPVDVIGTPELVGWPELTADCLPAPLMSYVMNETERLNIDPCALTAHVLAACSASISDAWRIKPKQHDHWTEQARLWCCVVKPVGARGTAMIRAAFWPLTERESRARNQWLQELAAWNERQANRKRGEEADDTDPEPKQPRFMTNDATVEAASEILRAAQGKHAKLAIVADELAGFLAGFNRYTANGAGARAAWLESYDGGPQQIERIKRGSVFVPNWSVIVAGNIQDRRFTGMADDLTDDGLFQRFLTIHAKPSKPGVDDDKPLNADAGRDYRALHDALADLQPATSANRNDGPAPAYFDDDAREVRRQFMPLIERLQFDPTLPTIIRETAPKWSGQLARLSLIFHLVGLAERRIAGERLSGEDLCRVTGATVTMAATFLKRIVLPNLFRLGFETLPENGAPAGHARWIAGYILAHKVDTITARTIGRVYRPLRGKPAEISEAMAVLVDASWARSSEGRHDSAAWAINPAVHQIFETAAQAEKARREHVKAAMEIDIAQHVTGANPELLKKALALGMSIEDAAEKLKISRATAFRWKAKSD